MENGNDRLDRIDQRLDRLTERHEALTHTVELLAGMHQDLVGKHQDLARMQQKNEALMAQVLEAINGLARIAQAHEKRLDDLESR